MSQYLSDINSKPLTNLKVTGFTSTVAGSFSTASNVITTLPAGHGILVDDIVSITQSTSATLLETGLDSVSDGSSIEAGSGILRVLKTSSMYGTISALRAAFTAGLLVSFQTGVLTGATVLIKTSPALGSVTAVDGSGIGDPTHWWIIFDMTTATGLPAIASYPSFTSTGPDNIYQGVAGSTTYSGLNVTISTSTSITVDGTVPNFSFTDINVTKHNKVVGKTVAENLEIESLKIGSDNVYGQELSVPYSGSVAGLTLLWKGLDDSGNEISSANIALGDLTAAVPTGLVEGVDINLIQLLSHPTHKEIGVMVYFDITTSKIMVRCFKFTYDAGWDTSATAFELIGADSTDIRASFITQLSDPMHTFDSPYLFILGGKVTPGTSVYGAILTINTTTLALSDSGRIAWGDTGLVLSAGTLTTIQKITDLEPIITTNEHKAVCLYDTDRLALFQYAAGSNTLSIQWEVQDSTVVDPSYDYFSNSDNTVLVVKGTAAVSVFNTVGTSYTIPQNNFSVYRKFYTGVDYGTISLFKIDFHSGIGFASVSSETLSGDFTTLFASQNTEHSYNLLPANFQNGTSRADNKVFLVGDDKLLFYQSASYIILMEKSSGKFISLYKATSGPQTLSKSDVKSIVINGHTVLRFDGTDWKTNKILHDGPYLAYKKVGARAYLAASGTKVTTPYALEKGKIYYYSFRDNGVFGITPFVDKSPAFIPKKLGVALDTNIFLVDRD